MIEVGLAAAAYRYGTAVVGVVAVAAFNSNYDFNEEPELPDQLLPPPTTRLPLGRHIEDPIEESRVIQFNEGRSGGPPYGGGPGSIR